VMDVTNAVSLTTDALGELTLIGPGAGGKATASAVIADVADIACGLVRPPFGRRVSDLEEASRAPIQRHEGGYYIRLSVFDRPGAAAGIATRMAQKAISLESILQKRPKPEPGKGVEKRDPAGRSGTPVPVVLITYATTESAIREALQDIDKDGLIAEPPQVIRIEREDNA
jgi:homoserine dehydrogenase